MTALRPPTALPTLVLLAGLTACGGGTGTTTTEPAAAPTSAPAGTATPAPNAASGTVTAEDQTSDGRSIVVEEVTLDGAESGFIGVHQDLDGKPGPVVGVAPVTSGENMNVTVTFDQPVTSGAFWPMLHVDDHEIGTYEFPAVAGADLPVKDGDDIVMQQVTLTVS